MLGLCYDAPHQATYSISKYMALVDFRGFIVNAVIKNSDVDLFKIVLIEANGTIGVNKIGHDGKIVEVEGDKGGNNAKGSKSDKDAKDQSGKGSKGGKGDKETIAGDDKDKVAHIQSPKCAHMYAYAHTHECIITHM